MSDYRQTISTNDLDVTVATLAAIKDASREVNDDPELQHALRLSIDLVDEIADRGRPFVVGTDGLEVRR